MSRIEDLIAHLCSKGVEHRPLGELASATTGVQLNRSAMTDDGRYAVFNGGTGPSGHHTDFNAGPNAVTVSQGGASAGYVNFVREPFWAGAHCYVVLPAPTLDPRFLYYALKSREERLQSAKLGAGIPGLSRNALLTMSIPTPPVEIQREIVTVLDAFTELEVELERELEARREQYDFYCNSFLTFSGTNVSARLIADCVRQPNGIKWQGHGDEQFQYIDLTSVDRVTHKIVSTATITSHSAPSRARQVIRTGDIIFGTTRPTLKRYTVITPEYDGQICSTGFCVLRPDTTIVLTNYLFHLLGTEAFQRYIEKNARGASYPAISDSLVKSYSIPVPSLGVQREVINVLDVFADLEAELEAELKRRRQQYEYYRDRLLTFPEAA